MKKADIIIKLDEHLLEPMSNEMIVIRGGSVVDKIEDMIPINPLCDTNKNCVACKPPSSTK